MQLAVKLSAILTVAGLLGLPNSGRANAFLLSHGTYTPVLLPGVDPAVVSALGINDAGVIVGTAAGLGFMLSGGVVTFLSPGSGFVPSGINDAGDIVGYCCGLFTQGILDAGGVFTSFDYPGSSITRPSGINNLGQIVGTSYGGPPPPIGFLFSNESFTEIRFPTANPFIATAVNGINDAGQIVGDYSDSSGRHGFLDDHGVFHTIDFPGSSSSSLVGIANSGQVVGWYADLTSHGFIYANGVFTTLEVPFDGVTGTQPRAINNLGDVVGDYDVAPPPPPPTPELGSAWFVSGGLGAATVMLLRRRRRASFGPAGRPSPEPS